MNIIMMVACICSIIILCILIFFILRYVLYKMIDHRIERFQSDLIEKQVQEIQNMYKQVRGWRHDYRNHIQNMKIQLDNGNYDKLNNYLNELSTDLNTVDTVIKTGNIMADAILNSKLSIAEKLKIKLNIKANIPEKLPLTDVELCSILGNMLDNSIEACNSLPQSERFLRVYIGRLKGQFYISIQNSAGVIKKDKNTYLSTKSGEHGYGIFRIDRMVKKYHGYVNRQNEEGVFATEILIPLDIN